MVWCFHFVIYDPSYCKIDDKTRYALRRGYLVTDKPLPQRVLIQIQSGYPPISTLSSRHGHFWLQKTKRQSCKAILDALKWSSIPMTHLIGSHSSVHQINQRVFTSGNLRNEGSWMCADTVCLMSASLPDLKIKPSCVVTDYQREHFLYFTCAV